jgi:phosphatidylserine/phosphatidylglycerophosphate/cardiolipin synthase-like enzyme
MGSVPSGVLLLALGCTDPQGSSLDMAGLASAEPSSGLPSTQLGVTEEWIQVDFTRPGIESGEGEDPELDDRLAELIEEAEVSVDMAIYDFDRELLIESVLSAWDRGLDVRVVGDEDEADDEGFASLEAAGIPVSYRPSSSRIMHNKFVVLDETRVWTGSTNLTDTGMERNNNNALLFSHDGLSAAYTAEFEQMFLDQAFGRSKEDLLATHEYTVAGTELDLFFSPQDDPYQVVIEAIEDAQHSIQFMVFSFTHDDIASALIDAADRGVEVTGIFDKSQASGRYSVDDELAMAGIPVLLDGNENTSGWAGGKLHHKVLVVDAGTPSRPTVITGSMNWSKAGTNDNDENLVRVQSSELAQLYASEFCEAYAVANVHTAYVGEVSDPCTKLESPPTAELEDAQVFVNEVLVVDADGVQAGSFIELLHTSDEAVELEGASLVGSFGTLVEFGAHRMEPGESVVLCGSSAPSDLPCDLQVPGELELEWGGEYIELLNADGELADALYLPPALPGTSLNRSPDGDGEAPLVRHDDISTEGLLSSPGTRADGSAW